MGKGVGLIFFIFFKSLKCGTFVAFPKLDHFWTITFSWCGKSNLPTTSLSNSFRVREGDEGKQNWQKQWDKKGGRGIKEGRKSVLKKWISVTKVSVINNLCVYF